MTEPWHPLFLLDTILRKPVGSKPCRSGNAVLSAGHFDSDSFLILGIWQSNLFSCGPFLSCVRILLLSDTPQFNLPKVRESHLLSWLFKKTNNFIHSIAKICSSFSIMHTQIFVTQQLQPHSFTAQICLEYLALRELYFFLQSLFHW